MSNHTSRTVKKKNTNVGTICGKLRSSSFLTNKRVVSNHKILTQEMRSRAKHECKSGNNLFEGISSQPVEAAEQQGWRDVSRY